MESIRDYMAENHLQCDEYIVAVEQDIAGAAWDKAGVDFPRFRDAMHRHLAVEESILFPAFEQRTGMAMGPTQVMRNEHAQIRELIEAAEGALLAKDADDYSGYAETLLIMTQQHNMKEENILYPMCDQHLSDQLESMLAQLKSGISATRSV